jgi:hypothetical protein
MFDENYLSLCRKEYMLLKDLQEKLVVNHLTEPILGNFHAEFRSRENSVRTTVAFCNNFSV